MTKRKGLGDRKWVLAFLAVDALIAATAVHYYGRLTDLTSSGFPRASRQEEERLYSQLESLAEQGSFDAFEAARAEGAASLLRTNRLPDRGAAVYFFPETLPRQSFERDFAVLQLKPGIAALRRAYDERNPFSASHAFRVLESRVENYELGLSGDPNELSDEARLFLRTYKWFSLFPDLKARTPGSQNGKKGKKQ